MLSPSEGGGMCRVNISLPRDPRSDDRVRPSVAQVHVGAEQVLVLVQQILLLSQIRGIVSHCDTSLSPSIRLHRDGREEPVITRVLISCRAGGCSTPIISFS